MAEPTLSDVMAAIAALRVDLATVKLQNAENTGLLNALFNQGQIMTQLAQDTNAAVTAENTKVDQLLSLVQPAFKALQDQLAAAQAQAVDLQAKLTAAQSDAAADATTLTGTLASAQAETAKVQAAIDALTPPPAG